MNFDEKVATVIIMLFSTYCLYYIIRYGVYDAYLKYKAELQEKLK